jgi:hypothetical protein
MAFMNRFAKTALLAAATAALWAAGCGSESNNVNYDGTTDGIGSDTLPDGTLPDTPLPDTTDPGFDMPTGPKGSIRGVVYSPESWTPEVVNFPVSGALVFIAHPSAPPPPVPEAVYCNECVAIEETVPHAFSAADGSFQIDGITQGAWLLVVQKGEFRKTSYIDVVGDTTTDLDRSLTTFPRVYAPPNDFTPKMAIALGSYDIMEDIVAKMGLCPINAEYHWDGSACDHIDMFCNKGGFLDPCDFTPFENLLRSLEWMREYKIIFVPCSDSTTDSVLRDATVQQNIRQWVSEGGKWYVADWSYDFVEQVFPDFLDFEGNDTTIGSADGASDSFNTTGRAVDADLRDWLLAIGEPADSIEFLENWDCIQALGTVPGFDEDGNPVSITPYTWAEGPITRSNDCMSGSAPLTMTFPYGCGKVLFTTYHTVGEMGGEGRPTLITQEKILFYLILEIGLCTEEVVII